MADLEFNIKANFDQIEAARKEMERLRAELQKTTKATNPIVVQDLTDRYAEQRAKVAELSSAMSRYATVMSSDYSKKMQNLTREVYSFELQADASKRKMESITNEIAKLQATLRKGGLDIGTKTVTTRDLKELSVVYNDEKRRYDNLTGLGEQARKELQNMQAEYAKYSGATNSAANNVKIMTDALSNMVEEMKKVPTVGEGASNLFARLGGDAKQLAMSLVGGLGFEQLAEHIFNVRSQFQQLEISFNTMLQSEQKAGALMSQLLETAKVTPFNMTSITEGAKQLLAYGIQANEVNETLIHLGDIASGLNIPLGQLVYLYGTTIAQGRMYTMDLRQFMGRGVPMAEELGKIMGKTTQEVRDAITDGKVGADLVKEAIFNMSAEGGRFGGLMEKQALTLQGRWSNIEDSVDQMFNEMGKKTEGIFGYGLDKISALVENWETVVKVIGTAAVALGTYKAGLMATASIQKAQNAMTLKSITDNVDAQINTYKEQAKGYREVSGGNSTYKEKRVQELTNVVGETNMIGNKQTEELVALKIKQAQTDGIITQQMAEQLQLKRDMLVAQQQSTANEAAEAAELSKGLDDKMAQFKEMEGDYRHLNGKDTKEYKANRYSELGDALTDTENIGDEATEERISKQIELAKSEGLISDEMAKQLQLKRDLLVEQAKIAEKEQAEYQNAINAKEKEAEELMVAKEREREIAILNEEDAIKKRIASANETELGKAMLKTHELETQYDLQQSICDKTRDEAFAKKENLVNLDEQIQKQKELVEQMENNIVNDYGSVDTTSFGGYEDGFSERENNNFAQYDAEVAKLDELMQKRTQAVEEFESAKDRYSAARKDMSDAMDALKNAEDEELEAYKNAGDAVDEIEETVQKGIDIQEGKTTITEMATMAVDANTASEQANTTSKNINSTATQGESVATNANTTTEQVNTTAKNVNTTSENLNTGATERNTIATKLHTLGTRMATIAEDAWTFAINAATTSLKGLWAAMLANPLTSVITLVTTAISIFTMFADTEEDVSEKTQNLSNKASEASNKVRALFATLGDGADGRKHTQTINELKSAYEEYGVALNETIMKGDDEIAKIKEIQAHREELIGVIEQQTLAIEHQNNVQAAYDEYNSTKDNAKSKFVDDTDGTLNADQARIATSLVTEEDVTKLSELSKKIASLKYGTKEWEEADKAHMIVVTEVEEKMKTYYSNLGLTNSQIRDLSSATLNYINSIERGKTTLDDRLDSEEKASKAAEKASKATNGLTEKQERQAAINRAVKKTFKELNSDIQNTINMCSNKLQLKIKVNYDDSELPKWIKNMSLKQLKASMAVRQDFLDKHKPGDVLKIGGQWKTYEQVANELAMMQARGNNEENKQEESEKEKEKKRKAAERARAKAEREQNERETRAGNTRKATEDYFNTISTYSEKAEDELLKRRTSLIKDSTEKEIEELRLSTEKEKKAIEDGIDKLIEARKKKDQTIWVNEKKGRKANMWKQTKTDEEYRKEVLDTEMTDKDGKSTGTTIGKNADERKNLIDEQSKEKLQKIQENELNSMRSYVAKYGALKAQKLALTEEYNAKIDKARKAGNEYEAASLEKELKEKIQNINFEDLKVNLDWETVFNDISSQTTSALKNLKEKLKEALKSKDLTPENAKVFADKIREIEDTISKRTDVWGQLLPNLRERKKLTQDAADAQKEYNKALSEQIDAQLKVNELQKQAQGKIEQATGNKVSLGTISKMSKDDYLKALNLDPLSEAGIKAANEFDKLIIATTDLEKAQQNLTATQRRKQAINDAISGGKGIKGIADAVFNTKDMGFTEIVSLVNTNAQSMNKLVQDIGLGNTEFGQAVGHFSDGVKGFNSAIQSLASGDVMGFVDGVVNGFQGFGKMLGIGGGNAEKVNKAIKNLTKQNESLSKAIESLKSDMQKQGGMKAVATAEKALDYQNKINENNAKKVNKRMGYNSAHHSFSYYWKNGKSLTEEEKQRMGEAMGLNGDWNGDLHNLTPEQAKAIMQDYEVSEKIRNTGKGGYGKVVMNYIEELAEGAEAAQDLIDQLNESLTQISFDSLKSDFINSLMDMNKSAKEFSNDFSKMLMQAVLSAKISDMMDKDLKAFYEKWAKMQKENGEQLTKDNVAELKKDWDSFVQQGIEYRDQLADITGYKESYSQSSTTGAFESMSQDTGEELNGRFTAVQIATEGTYQVVQEINQKFSQLLGLDSEGTTPQEELKDDMQAKDYLDQIATLIPTPEQNNDTSFVNANLAQLMQNGGQMYVAMDEGRTILAQSLMCLQSIDERQEKWHKPMLQLFKDVSTMKDKINTL